MPRLTSLHGCFGAFLVGALLGMCPTAEAQLVPGTGNLLNYDDLEDANWGYVHNFPKSSKEEDETIRYPLGASNNRMWSESPKRGSPDVVKRVETPAGGLAGSTGSLYMRTRDSGIPGHPGNKQAQDDFILSARPVAVGYSPNFVVRVYVPEFEAWEQRQGVSFGIRAGLQGMMTKEKPASLGKRFFRGRATESVTEVEPYYPGFFIAFNPVKVNPAYKEDHAQILIRSDNRGNEVAGPKITQTGWWTFGMSVTPDSRCHYYAHAGISDLTAADHIYSSLPYGIRGDHFNTIFFNVCSADNASSWSTPWIIDDPKVYYSGQPVFKPAQQQAQQPQPVKTAQATTNTPNAQNASMSKEVAAPAVQAPAQPGAALIPPPATPMVPATTAPATPAPMVTTPVAAPAPESKPPVAPVLPAAPAATTPAPSADATPVSPAAAPTAPPALLSTGPAVSLKPAQPLTIPVSKPVEVDTTPISRAPLLILPGIEGSETTPPAVTEAEAKPEVKAEAPTTVAVQPEEAVIPESNPFDDAQKPNLQTATAKSTSQTPAVPVTSVSLVAVPTEDEPPLVLPETGDPSIEVDPAPVPLPPSE